MPGKPESDNGNAAVEASRELDVRGLNCPLPVLKTKVALRDIEPGEVMRVLTTDPASVLDFRAYCDTSDHELIEWREQGEEFEFLIRKGPARQQAD